MSDLDSSFDSSHDTHRFGMDDVDSLSDQSEVTFRHGDYIGNVRMMADRYGDRLSYSASPIPPSIPPSASPHNSPSLPQNDSVSQDMFANSNISSVAAASNISQPVSNAPCPRASQPPSVGSAPVNGVNFSQSGMSVAGYSVSVANVNTSNAVGSILGQTTSVPPMYPPF